MPATSVITAVNQVELTQAILPMKAIVFTRFNSIIPLSAKLDNPNQRALLSQSAGRPLRRQARRIGWADKIRLA